MSTIERGKGSHEPPPPEKVYYKVTVAAFNKKTGKWEEVKTDIGLNVTTLIKDQGDLEFFKTAGPGQILELTEKGIYTKSEEKGWIVPLTKDEIKMRSDIQTVMEVATKNIQRAAKTSSQAIASNDVISSEFIKDVLEKESERTRPNVVIQVKILSGPAEHLKALIGKTAKKNPVLAAQLSDTLQELNDTLGKVEKVRKEQGDEASSLYTLVKDIETLNKRLETLEEAAKVANFEVDNPQLKQLKFVREGQIKRVFKPNVQQELPYAFYVARMDGLFDRLINLKEGELKKEAQTANLILFELHKKGFATVFEGVGSKGQYLSEKVFSKYGSLKELLFAIDDSSIEQFAKDTGLTRDEVAFIFAKQAEIKTLEKLGEYLAIDYHEIVDAGGIKGTYMVRTSLAKWALEDELRENKELNLRTRFQLISNILDGWSELHLAGFVQGDPKPENILVYEKEGKLTAKLSDFGKTVPIQEKESHFYSGNFRFSPPEGRLSKKGEVYSAALVMIRTLEEPYLDKDGMLFPLNPEEIDRDVEIDSKRRGVEKFVVLNKKMPQTETKTLMGKVRALSQRLSGFIFKPTPMKEAETEIHRYINALTAKLTNLPETQRSQLNTLLKDMTRSDPETRISMAEANRRFKLIMQI